MADTDILAGDLHFGEGPRWHDDRLWLSDFYAHAVLSVSLEGDVRTELVLDDQPSGLGWLPDGRLLVASMTRRVVVRREHDGSVVDHADLSGIAGFHINDMIVDSSGHAYVGNFGFDLEAAVAQDGMQALLDEPGPVPATLALVGPDGSTTEAARGMAFPNGMVITPDGATLIVAETLGKRLTAFERRPDGTLSNRRVWASLVGDGLVLPDGICLDADGAVWVANPVAPCALRVAEGGEVLARVETTQPAFACALGGPQRRHLVICTAPSSSSAEVGVARNGRLEVVEVPTPGAGIP